MRFVSEEQNYFCLKSEIKNVSKYGKVMLTWAVISTKQLISSFLVMLHLTVFCLNQLWRTARTWKLLGQGGHSLNSLCLLHSERALVPLCPRFTSLPGSLTSALNTILHGLLEAQEGVRDRMIIFREESLPVSLEQNSLFSVPFWFQIFSVNLFTVEEVEWQVDWRNTNLQRTVGNQTQFSTHQEFQPSGKHICRKSVSRIGIKKPSTFYKKEIKIPVLL